MHIISIAITLFKIKVDILQNLLISKNVCVYSVDSNALSPYGL